MFLFTLYKVTFYGCMLVRDVLFVVCHVLYTEVVSASVNEGFQVLLYSIQCHRLFFIFFLYFYCRCYYIFSDYALV